LEKHIEGKNRPVAAMEEGGGGGALFKKGKEGKKSDRGVTGPGSCWGCTRLLRRQGARGRSGGDGLY